MIEAYPLAWPAAWPRTNDADRRRPKFSRREMVKSSFSDNYYSQHKAVSVFDATKRLIGELKKLGVEATSVIVSTNLELRLDGLPRSNQRAPEDPGVAVYWTDPKTKQQRCMAIDIYATVAGNLAAVAASIEALRAIERHGGATILNRAFEGFKALPGSTTTALSTDAAAEVIGPRAEYRADLIVKDREHARAAVRRAQAKAHPDAGGTPDDFQLVQEAKRVLEAHFGGQL